MAEFAADHGADLGDFLDPSKAVEARYQRIVQGCRDGNRCRRTRQLIVVAEILKPARLEHSRGQFLDEQGDAVGANQDLVDDFRRQRLTVCDLLEHSRGVTAGEARQDRTRADG
jgi:hypothetical protein